MDDTNVPALLEVDVGARASGFHIIIGKHQWGRFICVPSWQIGSELAELSDRSWNLERLCSDYPDLREVNVISIVDALRKLSKYYDL